METYERILVGVDKSPASEKAVAYVGHFVSRCTKVHMCLLYVLPPIPPAYLESGGSSIEQLQESEELKRNREAWIKEEEKNMQPTFEHLRGILSDAGVPQDSVLTCCYASHPGESAARGILDMQCGGGFSTIVLGRNTFPWYQRLFHRHVCEDILREAKGLAIWIVD